MGKFAQSNDLEAWGSQHSHCVIDAFVRNSYCSCAKYRKSAIEPKYPARLFRYGNVLAEIELTYSLIKSRKPQESPQILLKVAMALTCICPCGIEAKKQSLLNNRKVVRKLVLEMSILRSHIRDHAKLIHEYEKPIVYDLGWAEAIMSFSNITTLK